jgi:MFS family permease
MLSLKKHLSGLSRNTYLLACASFFGDVSTEMLYPVLPVFLTQTLGASASVIGVIEGVAQATQYIAQGFSGWLADSLRRRKTLAVAGFVLAALAKPLIGLSTGWLGVLGARSLDRIGAGTRSAPRDALVAASADAAHRGRAFGLEGLGDNLGACIGPLIAFALVAWLSVGLRSIFFLAVIPGLLGVFMVLLVRDKAPAPARGAKPRLALDFRRFPAGYWRYLVVTAVFGVGNSSNSFLILRTKDLGASLTTTILIYALFNLVAAIASYPAGHFSDTRGRRGVLLVSFTVFLVVYAGFAFATNLVVVGALFALYGLYQGMFRAVGKALAVDLLPTDLHASGIGLFSAVVGLSALASNLIGGMLWMRVGPTATFLFGAAFALLGSIALVVLVPTRATANRGA